MPYRRIYFEKNKPVHIVSRSVIDVFKQKEDCYRFIFQFYVTNLGKRGFNVTAKDAIKAGQALLYEEKIPPRFVSEEHSSFVYLLDFSLVMNHYHFYLLPTSENVIPIFMQKLNNGFAQSFNLLHKRKDAVFGSRYKGVVVEDEFQSHAVSRYVSIINPLDIFQPGWREAGLKNSNEAFNFLEDYEFSTFPDKIRKRKAQILAPQEILEQYAPFWGDENEYREFAEEFLKERLTSSRPAFIE
ncbi:MAG: hypothetical protein A2896_00240 [Candidatus Nealsonbacteria bacterium RIFCSPLOWO2_01_FULL_43_32]|uniref:Transposase IS200-like domain-containing protein n=1 Tax=Candidatus Nealsonbacteria bacterium RIFCSPLOWO2_01_FULL_43_32 TaxID=1801672 RepID=A0A1G2EEP3_9BACT|nr:MAG: hypothetical protein A2896_00240 [Candidatus Nealsonbacteria bacterium RIFCSPLOWO2_01_FULL_43_32]